MEHDEQADALEREAEELEEHGDQVDREIRETRRDWESKEGDDAVPGAVPEAEEDEVRPNDPEPGEEE